MGAAWKRYVAEGAVVAGRGAHRGERGEGAGCLTESQDRGGADRSGRWAGVEPSFVGDVTGRKLMVGAATARRAHGSQQGLSIRELAPKR